MYAFFIVLSSSVCPYVHLSVRLLTISFKNLLQNQMANLDKTWQECSLDEALQKLFKNLIPSKTLVAMATKWLKMVEIFKNLLVTNHKAESIHILYEASLGDPLPKLLKLFP